MAEKKEPTSMKLILTMAVAGLLSGLLLVVIYVSTLPTIQKNAAAKLEAAVFRVLPTNYLKRHFRIGAKREGRWRFKYGLHLPLERR